MKFDDFDPNPSRTNQITESLLTFNFIEDDELNKLCRRFAAKALEEHPKHPGIQEVIVIREIKGLLWDNCPLELVTENIFASIFYFACEIIDWAYIARHYLEEMKEEAEAEAG